MRPLAAAELNERLGEHLRWQARRGRKRRSDFSDSAESSSGCSAEAAARELRGLAAVRERPRLIAHQVRDEGLQVQILPLRANTWLIFEFYLPQVPPQVAGRTLEGCDQRPSVLG